MPKNLPVGDDDYTPTGVFATDFEKYVELNDAFPVEIATIAAAPAAAAAAAASEDEPEPATKMRGSAKPRIELGAASPEEEEAGHPQWIRIAGWTVDPPMMNALIPTCNASETLSTIKFWNAGLCNETFDELVFALGSMSVTTLHIDDNVPPAGTEMDATRFAYLVSATAHSAADEQGAAEDSNTDADETEEAESEGGDGGEGAAAMDGSADDGEDGGGGGDGDGGRRRSSSDAVDTRVFLPLTSLRSLSLKGNGIRDPAATKIGEELSANTTLATLSLYRNKIGDAGGSAVFKALRLNRTLRSLNIGQNLLTDSSIVELSEALSELVLTHAETVMRRKVLLSSEGQEALAAHAAAASGSAHGDGGSAKRGSKLGGGAKSGHAGAKSGKKDRVPSAGKRGKSSRNPGSSKGGKGKSRGGGDEDGLGEMEPPSNPLLEVPRSVENQWLIPGNRVLINLNLAHNKVGAAGIAALQHAVQLQSNFPSGSGLVRCSLQGNSVQSDNADMIKIQHTMAERDPYAGVERGGDQEEEE